MSYSLKREIELYVNTVDSSDGVCKIAILPEFELKIQANLLQVYRKIIGEDPEMLPRSGVDQISPVSLGFLTYLKPAMLDGLIGHTAPEKLFWDSLGGVPGFRGKDYYKVNFGRVNRLLPLYFFIKTTTAIYKISKVYVDSIELSFDINYILIGKWTAQAISLDTYKIDEITFTNVKDYTNVDSYIRNKFTELRITDSKDGKIYNFPIIESNIKIQNALMPVYDKNIKVVVGTVKDLIVGGRAVSGIFKSYLSGKFKHSRDFLDSINEDLTQVNRKYKIEYIAKDRYNNVSITLPHAYINVPNLEFEDVLNVNIEFTSAESVYGANDDLDIKYYSKLQYAYTDYNDYIQAYKGYSNAYQVANKTYGAVSYWRCNDNSNKEIKDHISDKTMSVTHMPLNGLDGPLCNDATSKSFRFSTANGNQQVAYQDLDNIPCNNNNSWAFWVKINESILDGYSALLTGDYWDPHSVPLYRHTDGSYKAGVGGIYHMSGIPDTYWIHSIGDWNLQINKWHFLAVTYDKTNNIGKMYQDGVLIATWNSNSIGNYAGTRAIYINQTTPQGYSSANRYNNMDIAEISVFNYVLSENHIKSLYYFSGCGPGYNVEVFPEYKQSIINGKTPLIFIGQSILPIKSTLTVEAGSAIGTNTRQVIPQHKYIFCRNYQKPTVNYLSLIMPTHTSIIFDTNNIPTMWMGKRIAPIKKLISVRKNNVTLLRKISTNTKHTYLNGAIPSIYTTYKLIRPSVDNITLDGYISIIKTTKSIKPTKGTIRVSPGDLSLQLYYKFNESSGTTLIDYSSFNRHATLYNTPTLNQSGPHLDKKSIRFERASLEHAIYNSSISWPIEGSISLWIYPVTQQNYDMCFQFNHAFNQGNNTNYFRFYRENSTNWWVMPFASGGNSNWQVTVNSGEWTHIAITWNSTANQLSVYRNGSIVINNGSHSSWPTSLQPLGICKALKDGMYYYWDGNISTFTLHNKRLTATDVSNLYNNTYAFIRESPTIYQRGHPITGHNTAVGYIPEVSGSNTSNVLVQMIII